ncbi:MAG: helix-turn-helix domain-containing protein [Oscillospiraceae bacterium]|jgi:transcriptional regulator with XRE-family HTH domain|nr:helix-turn-helix domain-containing protein [Oscillospiraceae bacterium]
MTFAENLMELRRAKGYSQEELGFLLGVTRQTVSKWETGQTTPELDKLIALSRLCGVSIDELAGNDPADGTSGDSARTVIMYPRTFCCEYKSRRTLFGLPLVHVNVGFGARRAKGIIAVGNIAQGVVAVGALSLGVVSLGALSAGLLAVGAAALGVLAAGGLAVGALAAGGIAVGLLAFGGVAVGRYAVGGYASASNIAMGGYARGHIAIGDTAAGDFVWGKIEELTKADYEEIKDTILREYPNIWKWLLDVFVRR